LIKLVRNQSCHCRDVHRMVPLHQLRQRMSRSGPPEPVIPS
jgi:hypothetical protein